MPLGTRLGEFEIERVLGAGGFGIVYLALDHSLMRQVAVKEYFPSVIASRSAGAAIQLRAQTDASAFAAGLRSFLNEARLLAGFDHASLVKVHRYWEANGTAYMVMPYYAGRTLKQVRQEMTAPPSEAWLRGVLEQLLSALDLLHSESVYHRDVSPDNVMLLPDGRPVLLDFGSARRVAAGATVALTAIVKPNFAPIEQYADMAMVPQGPWTDLYAVGAVAHFLIFGEAPTPAVMRAIRDDLPLLAGAAHGPCRLGKAFATAIDWALAVDQRQRPQSVAELLGVLSGQREAPTASARHGDRPSPCADAGADAGSDAWRTTSVEPVALAASRPPSAVIVAPPGVHGAQAAQRRRRTLRATTAVGIVTVCALALAGHTLGGRDAGAEPPKVVAALSVPAPSAPPPVAEPVGKPSRAAAADEREPSASIAKPARTRAGSTTAATRPAAPSALGACAEKNFLMRAICVRRACDQPTLRLHPECVQMRKQDAARIPVEP